MKFKALLLALALVITVSGTAGAAVTEHREARTSPSPILFSRRRTVSLQTPSMPISRLLPRVYALTTRAVRSIAVNSATVCIWTTRTSCP